MHVIKNNLRTPQLAVLFIICAWYAQSKIELWILKIWAITPLKPTTRSSRLLLEEFFICSVRNSLMLHTNA